MLVCPKCSGPHFCVFTGLKIGRESFLTSFASTELSAELPELCVGVSYCCLRDKNITKMPILLWNKTDITTYWYIDREYPLWS